jgi:hypothetical protein
MPLPAMAGVASFFAGVILYFAQFLGKLALTFIGLLVEVAQYNDFINAPAVQKGWVVMRDIVNMFFIVILLMLAFGTVFRVEHYQYKHSLSKVLIMAVLVNFSKSIAGFVIDVGQVVMLTFVNGFKEAAAGNFVNGFGLDKMFQFAENNTENAIADEGAFFYAALLALIALAITCVVVGVYLIIFMLRIAVLWLLVITSPLAFLASAFPGESHLKEEASKWWKYFGNYVVSGPLLAFFLWLSLSVMQFGSNALGDFIQPGKLDQNIPAAAITQIGGSEVLLSFIINIVLLLGGLYMAHELGVAGGSLAAGALNKIQNMGKAPLRWGGAALGLAGKGAKGLVRWGWQEAGARMGIETSLDKWKHGWQEGKALREQKRQNIRLAAYGKHREKRSMMQFLGSPGHLFTELWNTKSLGKLAKAGPGGLTGTTYDKTEQELHGVESELAAQEELLGPDRAEEYRKLLSKGIDEDSREKDILTKQSQAISSGKDVELVRDQAEDLDRAADTEFGKGNLKLSEQKRNKSIDLAQKAKEMEGTKDERLAETEASLLAVTTSLEKKQKEAQLSDEELDKIYQSQLKTEGSAKAAEAEELEKGGLTSEQKAKRDGGYDRLNEQLTKLRREIKQKESQHIDVKADKELENSLVASMNQLKNPDTGAYTIATEQEKKSNKERIERLRKEVLKLKTRADRPTLTQLERAKIEVGIKELEEKKEHFKHKAHEYKPAEDYDIRREQRIAINKEKSDMDTDNWQELVQICKDAVHSGNAHRAAAAYLKATEYGNENEFQNEFGYDSDAGGLRQFTEKVLQGKLGLSQQQALAIASDVSYAGEKVRHWMVARAVKTKDGKLDWTPENERQVEMLAEIRKIDPEGFMRNANRLAFFNERVGYGEPDFPDDATDEMRAEHFQKTGKRASLISPSGITFLVEGADRWRRLLETGRFNVNMAVNIAQPHNMRAIKEALDKSQVLKGVERKDFDDILEKIAEFSGSGGQENPFANIESIIKVS